MTSSARASSPRTVAPALVLSLLFALIALGASALPAGAQRARDVSAQSEQPEVREVRFVGVHAVSKPVLAQAVATQASQCLQLLFRPFCLFSKSPYIYQREYLNHTELARDVVRVLVFYYKRGWRDAQVDTTVARAGRNAVTVTFTVREGPPTLVRTIAVGDTSTVPGVAGVTPPPSTVPNKELAGLLAPKPGKPLNTLRLDTAVVAVRDAYYEDGYGNAIIERPHIRADTAAHLADVLIPVAPGPLTPIARIDIVHLGAQHKVKDQTIRNAITIKPGDLFRRSEIARSQRALYESGLFRSALIDTAVATDPATGRTVCASQAGTAMTRAATPAAAAKPDSTKSLAICVAEAPLREARASVGFNTADFFQIEGRFTHNYFTGTSRRLDVQGVIGNLAAKGLYRALPGAFQNPFQASNLPGNRDATFFLPTYNVGVNLQQDYVGSPRNTLGAGIFASRRSSPGVYVDQSQGANLTFTRRVLYNTPVSLTYRFALSRVQAGGVYFCVNFGVCDAPTINILQSQKKLSPISGVISFSRTDDPLEPTHGTQGQAAVEHASQFTLSDFKYNRISAGIAVYHPAPMFPQVTLAARIRGGYVAAFGSSGTSDVLNPQTRFYAGGAQSVRGYGENQLGPRVLTVAPNDVLGSTTRTVNGNSVTTYACPAAAAAANPNSEAVLRECFALRRDSLGDGYFTPRALGGSALLEGSVEARVRLFGPLIGAVFVDAGALGTRSLRDLTSGTIAVTPGFGFRYLSPVGPVRIDLGIRPRLVETLPVITQYTDSAGVNRLLPLASGGSCATAAASVGCRNYPADSLSGLKKITGRLVLHLSIGEAF